MRTIARGAINLFFLLAAIAGVGLALTSHAYGHASHGARTAMLIAAAAVPFAVACVVLHMIPSKAKLAARRQAARPALPYATARRGR